jgi:biopolymer transport protein ExbD
MIDIGRSRGRYAGFTGLTPLIDIVFMLIMYFMLAGSLVQPDLFHVTLPVANGGEAAPPAEIMVDVSPFGELAVNGEPVSREKLVDRVRQWAAASPDRDVIVRTDARTTTGDLHRTLQLLSLAGVRVAHLATEQARVASAP